MKKAILPLAIATLVTQANAGVVTTDGADIVIKTKGGFEARTTDGKYSFKIGGRVQLDYNDYDGVINKVEGKSGDDLFFRRARLEVKGKANDWAYEMTYNLTDSGSINDLNTTYLGWGKMAKLTFGQQKEFFGLEDTGSSKWTTTIERSMPASAFDTGNTVGIKLHGANDMLTYSAGVFKEEIDADDNSLDSAITGRVVFRPVYGNGNLVHLGLGYTNRDGSFSDIAARLGIRGGKDKTANKIEAEYADLDVPAPGDSPTGPDFTGDELEVVNFEFAAASGPVHFMAEYFDGEISGAVDAANVKGPDLEADGYSVQLGWIVTGESRSYKTSIAAFDKVKPKGANGAWEVFARFDTLDVDNSNVLIDSGAEEADILTLGVNWYMNSNVKVAVNYVRAETDQKINNEDDGDALVARLQFAF